MSLVISAWDQRAGVAVCEGRVGTWVGGQYVPTEEDHSKLTRLPNGGVLGIAGHSREGFSSYASLLDVASERLRPAIVEAARANGFCELSRIIPALLAECKQEHPELFFCVSLLGTDNGTVRGGAWDSDGKESLPTEPGVSWLILSPSAEFSADVDATIRVSLEHIGLLKPAVTSEVLQNVIRFMAHRHPDINGRTWAEIVSPRECMNADNITTGALSADKVVFSNGDSLDGQGLAEMQADCTANHIAATGGQFPSTQPPSLTPGQTATLATIPVSIQSTGDVILLNGIVSDQAGGPGTGQVVVDVDSTAVFTGAMMSTSSMPVIAYISGLSAGTHTITITLTNKSNTSDLSVVAGCLTVTVLQIMGSGAGFAFSPIGGVTRPKPLIS